MKTIAFLLLVLSLPLFTFSQNLRISPDGHHLVKKDGTLFFYLGDTAWELFHRCSKEQTEMYLKVRKEQGFNVIQAVALAELDGLNTPNMEGEKPFIDLKTLKPDEAYFEHIDRVVKKAEELGMYIAMLPTWGDKWRKQWGVGPVIFDTPEKAYKYGKWLGKRYRDQPNIIWIMGGDRNPVNDEFMEINRAMAKGIKEGDKGNHLMTLHPGGGHSSSEWFHNDDWLDFNMMQTGHSAMNPHVYEAVGYDYGKKPVKPCINGEPQYEDHPVNFTAQNERFVAFDVRQAAYWSVLAGALGHTYGDHNVWQMWTPERKPVTYARIPWYYAIYQPGARQMGFMRKLFESRPFLEMMPDQNVLADVYGQNKEEIRAARGKGGSFVIVYFPYGDPAHLDLNKLSADTISGYWYNPREDKSLQIPSFQNTKKVKAFVPPSSGIRTDWVLLLDDASKEYPDPALIKLK